MIFHEFYGAYYLTVAEILKHAVKRPLEKQEMQKIIETYAFGESILTIEPALSEQKWQILHADGTTPIQAEPTMPLTWLQKRWLKALSFDPRLRLFLDEPLDFGNVPPLFTPEDIEIFDQYANGDNYTDEAYIKNFRLILQAIKEKSPLCIDLINRRGKINRITMLPSYLEYSEKDDKFRLFGQNGKLRQTVNLGRIIKCERYLGTLKKHYGTVSHRSSAQMRHVIFELQDERNSLERVLLHFAHFQKQAERIGHHRFRIMIAYDKLDETELVIRILSFGPMLQVTHPPHFVNLIKERLIKQKSCGL